MFNVHVSSPRSPQNDERKGGRGDDPPDQNFPWSLSPEKEHDACNADENKHLF